MKAQHQGAQTHPCIVRKNLQVPHTARHVACHSVYNSRGKLSSIPPHKTRPDCPVPNLQGPCDPNQKWRGTLRFLPQLEMRPSSIAPKPLESREAPPTPRVTNFSEAPLQAPEISGTSRGNPGFPAATRERLESPSLTRLEARVPYHGSRAMQRSQ